MAQGEDGATGLQCAAAAPPAETIILKLGGSSITDKGQCGPAWIESNGRDRINRLTD